LGAQLKSKTTNFDGTVGTVIKHANNKIQETFAMISFVSLVHAAERYCVVFPLEQIGPHWSQSYWGCRQASSSSLAPDVFGHWNANIQ
jgi:hypothetical protein